MKLGEKLWHLLMKLGAKVLFGLVKNDTKL